MTLEKKWYAIYTRARWEKKVAALLTKRSVDNYCPLNRMVRQWSDRKKLVLEPLFASYVFVHATEAEFLTIKQTDGVLTLVYWLGAPAVIRDEEIEAIQKFLVENENVKLVKADVNMNDTIKIISGAFTDLYGKVVEIRNKTVKVYLPTLGYQMIAEVNKDAVQVTDYNRTQTLAS